MARKTSHQAVIRLKEGREKSLQHRHPWIFSGAIDSVEGDPASGATVIVQAADGRMLASAAYSPSSQIRARVWSFDPRIAIDQAFFCERVERAVSMRSSMLDENHNGCRLIHAESDGLPGLIADRYGEVVVVSFSSAGVEAWHDTIVGALNDLTKASCIFERSDAETRALEGLSPRVGVVRGELPHKVTLIEHGLAYDIDVERGQKTGFFLDQRDNRLAVRELARQRDVLDVFCYSGGFTLSALAGDAKSVTAIDSSRAALDRARDNVANNRLPIDRVQWIEADVFAQLRRLRDAARSFDLIVLDPPKFAPTASHAQRAARAYKDINLWALKMLRPGGYLATFSCSGGIDADLFRKIVAGAAVDAGADAVVIDRYGASADHPVALSFPEGEYLKGLLLRKGVTAN